MVGLRRSKGTYIRSDMRVMAAGIFKEEELKDNPIVIDVMDTGRVFVGGY